MYQLRRELGKDLEALCYEVHILRPIFVFVTGLPTGSEQSSWGYSYIFPSQSEGKDSQSCDHFSNINKERKKKGLKYG